MSEGKRPLIKLPPESEVRNHRYQTDTKVFNYAGLRINESQKRLTVRGSLSKWKRGENISNMGLQDLRDAVEELSEELAIPLKRFALTRADIGGTVKMDYCPAAYYPELLIMDSQHSMKRLDKSDGVQYSNSIRDFVIYDKGKEAQARKQLPNHYADQNLLRMELRLRKKALSQFFGKSGLILGDLLTENNFYRAVSGWAGFYAKIQKRQNSMVGVWGQGTKELVDYFAAKTLQQETNFLQALEIVEQKKRMGLYKDRNQYNRQRNKLIELNGKFASGECYPLVAELDYKVNELVQSMTV